MGINGLDSLQSKLEKLKDDINDAANEAVEDSLDATERSAKRNIVEQDAVQTADMYRGFVQQTIQNSDGATRHTLSNEAPHAQLQEFGTGQQFGGSPWSGVFEPPSRRYKAPDFGIDLIRAIEKWIISKPSFQTRGPARNAAVPISASIAGMGRGPSGTPPQPFMRPAWFVQKPQTKRRVRSAVRRQLR